MQVQLAGNGANPPLFSKIITQDVSFLLSDSAMGFSWTKAPVKQGLHGHDQSEAKPDITIVGGWFAGGESHCDKVTDSGQAK